MKVAELLEKKGTNVHTIKANETIATLARRLQQHRVGAMVVSQDGESIDGIISERDIAYSLADRRGELPLTRVTALMTRHVVTCTLDDSVMDVARRMSEARIRHVPVERDGRLAGILSIRDILEFRLDTLERQSKLLQGILAATG